MFTSKLIACINTLSASMCQMAIIVTNPKETRCEGMDWIELPKDSVHLWTF
jgi:hypothetical protein